MKELKLISDLKRELFEKEIEIWTLKNSFAFSMIKIELQLGKRLLLCSNYYLEKLIPLIDKWSFEKVENRLIELSFEVKNGINNS